MPTAGMGIAPPADVACIPGIGISDPPVAAADCMPGFGICPAAGLPAAVCIPGTGISPALLAVGPADVPEVPGTGMPDALSGCFARRFPSWRLP
ncbi:hypothetical protein Q5762_04350 [Streptomyces sp. P9(2023)]|uniref:hypothetical protein n=1 Tax=Streptomyces sp. P9(2023) TaxID=3064394 RepID=UPI0028F3F87C|nr:hypothetical protein [Streptomyces sp. P9(2023)]MDT9687586.1 hypothetical protein [Streptomyces sp. P9(2023)]